MATSIIVDLMREVQKELFDMGYSVRTDGEVDTATLNAVKSATQKDSAHQPGSDTFWLNLFDTKETPLIEWAEIEKLMDEAGATLPEKEMLRFIFKLENRYDHRGVYQELKVPMVGLGQFYKPTWKAVSKKPYEYAAVPSANIEATLALLRSNHGYHKRNFRNIPFTANVAYLYHNQGAPAASRFLRTSELVYPHQSKLALRVFQEVANEKSYA